MDRLEKVEKIRKKTGVSFEDAKTALDAADGDVLDALVWLEKNGKIEEPEVSVFTTDENADSSSHAFEEAAKAYDESTRPTYRDHLKKFFDFCAKMIKKGCENFFVIEKKGEELLAMPVILLIILLLGAFWVTVPVIVAGLFCGFKFSFRGEIAKAVDINSACEKASETAESIIEEFTK